MLYFAGHGEKGKDGQFYFLTSQASFGDFETTGLAWEKVAALLAQTKASVGCVLRTSFKYALLEIYPPKTVRGTHPTNFYY